MRVSIVNVNWMARDAIGKTIVDQVRFFAGRGDQVAVFVQHPPEQVPPDVSATCKVVTPGELLQDLMFSSTDLYIYHYPGRYDLIETITEIDSGFVIFYYHNVTPPELWNREEERAILRAGVEGVTLACHADLVVSPSDYNLADLSQRAQLPAERLVKLPLAVDTSAFRPGPPLESMRQRYQLEDGPVLLFVGRMARNKRIDILVETLAALRRHPVAPQPKARLLLVGDNVSAPAYRLEAQAAQQRARELGVADGLIFAGRVDELPAHYNLASVYVCASQHEGFGVPLIEAMASGVPIVAAASTAMPDTVGDAGLLVPVDESGEAKPADMADAVVRVLTDGSLAADLRERGFRRVNNFTIEKYREGLAALIDQYVTNLPMRARPAATAGPLPVQGPQEDRVYWPELAAEARVAMPEYTIRSRVPVVGGLIAWVRRNVTSHLKEPYLDLIVYRQQSFNLRSAWTIEELTRRLVQLREQEAENRRRLREQEVENRRLLREQEAKNQRQQREQEAENQRRLREREAENQRRLHEQREAQAERLKSQRAEQHRLESQLARLEAQLAQSLSAAGSTVSSAVEQESLDAAPQQFYGINYMRCNEAVGGSLSIEMALYSSFVPLFRGRSGRVLDLGCGRGAFLQVMRREGIPAMGIDLDPQMVDACCEAGLEARQADVFAALRAQPDDSLGGIFCAHVVEHLPRTRLMELAGLCWQKLQPGAALVWITPNGGGLTALHATFYKDLTHTRPLHPDTMAFILQISGFVDVATRTLSDMPEDSKLQLLPNTGEEQVAILNRNLARLNDLIFGHLDCAAIARRPFMEQGDQ